jgi:hypothetical protein
MISVEKPTFQVWGDVTYVSVFLCQNTFLVEVVGITTTGYSLRYFYRYAYNDFAFYRKFLFLNPPKVGQDRTSRSIVWAGCLRKIARGPLTLNFFSSSFLQHNHFPGVSTQSVL